MLSMRGTSLTSESNNLERPKTVHNYRTAIIKQANRCWYTGLKDELIRDRLESGILNDQVSKKLLSKTDLTLVKAIKQVKPHTFKLKKWQYLELTQCRESAHILKENQRKNKTSDK